jgi:hypothetical protein
MFKIFLSSLLTLILGLSFFGSTYKPKPVCAMDCDTKSSSSISSSSSKSNVLSTISSVKPVCTMNCNTTSSITPISSSSSSNISAPYGYCTPDWGMPADSCIILHP